MRVVHLSLTPLAGAPIRIVKALNKWTSVKARLINLNPNAYGARTFDEDIDFNRDQFEARSLIKQADIIHCHHWIDLKHNPFGIDLRDKAVLRHFHSEPNFVSRHAGVTAQEVIFEDIPQLVVAQHQERYYPQARPVPNIINIEDIISEKELSLKPVSDKITIGFHPTSEHDCFSERWDTKAAKETTEILNRLQSRLPIVIENQKNIPHSQLMKIRSQCNILLDEMVTGSYHLTGLESLALGKPTFAYIDQRSASNIIKLTGSSTIPWLNFSLDKFESALEELCGNKNLRSHIGEASCQWMKTYWSEEKLVWLYLEAYRDVLAGKRQLRDEPIDPIFDIGVYDICWQENLKNIHRRLYS